MDILSARNINQQPSGIDHADIDRLEKHFNTVFPKGYRDFLVKFGVGVLNDFIRLYPPQKIIDEIEEEFRSRWREYFLWDENPELSAEQLEQAIIIGDTVYGDEFVFLPGSSDIYILARHQYNLPKIGRNLSEMADYVFRDDPEARRVPPYFHAFTVKVPTYTRSCAVDIFSQIRDQLLANPELEIFYDDNGTKDKDAEGPAQYFLCGITRHSNTQIKLIYQDDEGLLQAGVTMDASGMAADANFVLEVFKRFNLTLEAASD